MRPLIGKKTSSRLRAAPFLAALLSALLLLPAAATAEDSLRLNIQTDKESYRPGDRMTITANLTRNEQPVVADITFQVDDHEGNTLLIWTEPCAPNGTARIVVVLAYNATAGTYQAYGSAKVDNSTLISSHAIKIKKTVPPPPRKPDMLPWYLLALMLVVAGAALAYAFGRRGKGKPGEASADEKAAYEEKGRFIENAAPAAPVPEVYGPLPSPGRPPDENGAKAPIQIAAPFLIDEVFLVYRDGRLIAHETRRLSPKDTEVMTGMFTAVMQFVKESFAEEGELGSLEYGENEVLLERGQNVFLAVVVKGESPRSYRELMRQSVRNVEAQYSGMVEKWDGAINSFAGVKKLLLPLFDAAPESEMMPKKAEIELHSAAEFFQGYIRMKVAVKNGSRSVITGVEFEPLYDEQVFRLVKLEPGFEMRKGRIDFGVINPGIKRTVALYLEPLICTECFLEGALRYKDSEGELHSELLKKRKVEVVCPIFYTDENINTAMLRRLVNEELTQQDSRIYHVDDMERSYAIAKEVVRARQVRLVRELADERTTAREAWFFGITQETRHKIIIKVSMNETTRMLEVFVATPGKLMLTGCLAEIGREVSDRLLREGRTSRQLLDMARKEQVLRETLSLIEKYSEAEMDAGETDQ